MSEIITRGDIVACARTWLETPYQHQASRKGAGCDCLGLLRGIWRELYGAEPLSVPPYTPDWAEQSGAETLLEAAQNCLQPIHNERAQPGDILMFRMRPDAPCKHVGILSTPTTLIHAYWGQAVTESHLVPYWTRRWVFSFSFPERI